MKNIVSMIQINLPASPIPLGEALKEEKKIADNGKAKRSKKNLPGQLAIEYVRKSRKYKLQSVLHISPENGGNVLILTADGLAEMSQRVIDK